MLNKIGLGIGLVIGGWLVYLLTTSESVRLGVLIGGAFLLGAGLILVVVVVVMWAQAQAIAAIKPPTYNYRASMPPMTYPPQLPAGGQVMNYPAEQVVEGQSEVIG